MMLRHYETPYGGLIRINADGSATVVRRDFGLTDEPECSEAAHRQMWRWYCERNGIPYDPTMFPDEPMAPPVPPPVQPPVPPPLPPP